MMATRRSLHLIAVGVLFAAVLGFATDQPNIVKQNKPGALALKTFQVLYDLPVRGVDASAKDLESIIAAHHQLASSENETDQRLSLTIAGAVAYGLMNEIQRAESARLKRGPELLLPSVPFDKRTLARLWIANVPDFSVLLRHTFTQKDLITSYIMEHSSLEDVMSGKMATEIKDDKARERYKELLQNEGPFPFDRFQLSVSEALGTATPSSPDMRLIQILNGFEALRDLSLVVDLYIKGDLPRDRRQLEAMVEEVVKKHPVQKLSDGSPTSPFNLVNRFNQYRPKEPPEKYRPVLAGLLMPYADDLRLWPEYVQILATELAEERAKGAAEAAIKAPAQPPAVTNQVVAVAYRLGGILKAEGYQYPQKRLPAHVKTITDKQFVLMVVEQLVPALSPAAKTRILMSDLTAEDVTADKDGPVRRGDPRTKGIQQALVDLGIGEVIPPAMAQPGDLVQYWVVGFGGQNICFGRVGVIERTAAEGKWRHAWFYGPNNVGNGGIGTWPERGFELASEHITHVVRLKLPQP